ncbi:hypothetical protein CAL26_20985 [Bordetella genomosp. 9]|uniref:Type III secretion protein n=1 Tax=Bordetella genomosp. 9 TaxID=1416803 RepID=A0A261R521_9BORD|nr:CDC27 family protein [Bordetella genomosp. 9]OZI20031.1 hypothetical protein CAL26_20985 [Bordetella genomosp. 9]
MNQTHSAPLPAETIELLQVLAFLKLQNGKARDAVALLEACNRAGGCQGRALILLAYAQLRAGAPEQALSVLDRADTQALALPACRVVRAQALSAAGRHDEARQAMQAYAATRTSPPTATSA